MRRYQLCNQKRHEAGGAYSETRLGHLISEAYADAARILGTRAEPGTALAEVGATIGEIMSVLGHTMREMAGRRKTTATTKVTNRKPLSTD